MVIEKIEVEGMKGFKEAVMEGMKGVNIIVGPNGSGKTTLLEAIFMSVATGAPNHLIDINKKRNIGWGGGSPEQFGEGQVDNWFNEEGERREVRITSWRRTIKRGEPRKTVTVIRKEEGETEIRFRSDIGDRRSGTKRTRKHQGERFGKDSQEEAPEGMGRVPVRFTYEEQGQQQVEWRVFVGEKEGKVQRKGRGRNEVEATIIHSDKTIGIDIEGYAASIRNGTFEPVLRAVKRVAPEVEDVYVSVAGRQPGLWARLQGGKSIPFGETGGGAAAIAEIVHRVYRMKYGVILIDEVENGIYFENHKGMWKALFEAMEERRREEYEVQIIATTHSQECYQGALEANEGRETTIFQTERGSGDQLGKIRRIDGVVAIRAARSRAELR